jgi:serine/threonine protein kinase
MVFSCHSEKVERYYLNNEEPGSMSLSAGTRLGPYEIMAPIGAGGMGEVYLAEDRRLRRCVALKVLPPTLVSSPERRARFEREAQAAAAISHPNICTVFDVGEENGQPFIAMEYCEGLTLAARLRERPLTIPERCSTSGCRSRTGSTRRTAGISCTGISRAQTSW